MGKRFCSFDQIPLPKQENHLLRTEMQMIFQDPMACLNPRQKVADIIGQGLDIRYGKLYMPTGFGSQKHPSELYIWDLRHKKMKKYDLSACTTGELEDVAVLGRNLLLLQSQDGLFRVRIR